MLSSQNSSNNKPNFSKLPRARVLKRLLSLIEDTLLIFPSHLTKIPKYKTQSATLDETFFNDEFSFCLDVTARNSNFSKAFSFARESQNPNKQLNRKNRKGLLPQVDIGVRLIETGIRVFTIEGKRLHDKYDKQYVRGRTGGIARFKKETHGEDTKTNEACIIGYVQKETFDFWHNKINVWLSEEQNETSHFVWGSNESLEAFDKTSATFTRCSSVHSRLTLAPIKLTHYWVNVV